MRKSVTAFCLLCLLGLVACCNLNDGTLVQPSELLGSWYEVESYGDTLTAIFCKCIKNDIDVGDYSTKIQKKRSYKLKFIPFFALYETATLINQGEQWALETSSWFGSSKVGLSVLQRSENYLILKTCPHTWFTNERIWVYAKNKDLKTSEIAAINKALRDKDEPPIASFRTISQSC